MYNFHIGLVTVSIFFWSCIFYDTKCRCKKKREDDKIEHAVAIINNLQIIIMMFISYAFFDDTNDLSFLVSFVYIPSLNGVGSLNLFTTVSTYITLVYNLFDIFIQIYNKKYVFVIHHTALLPFFVGYLLGGYFNKLNYIYALLEISSLTYNLREIFPSIDVFHKVNYIIIRTFCTPLLIQLFIIDFFKIPLYLNLITSLSIILLTIFNFVSIKLSLKSLRII